MDFETAWGDAVAAAAKALWGVELGDRHRPFVEPPADARFGDATSGVPMRLAKDLRQPPPVIAKELAAKLAGTAGAAKVEAAAGYVNFTADAAAHGGLVRAIRDAGVAWGRSSIGKGVRVLVEHTSANPTGPMHIAHARQAAVGDALANALAFAGFDVAREFYVNDAGGQIASLGKSIVWRTLERQGAVFKEEQRGTVEEEDEHGLKAQVPDVWYVSERFALPRRNAYHGEYVKELAAELEAKHGRGVTDVALAAQFGRDRMVAEIKEDAARFRVAFDTWYSEDALRRSGKVESLLEFFRSWGLSYTKDGATWLKSTDFGEGQDRVLVKKDGEYTYRTPDTAYHRDKFDRGFDWLIDTWGPDHHAEIANRTAGLKALNFHLLPREEFLRATRGGTPEQKARCFEVLIIQYCRLLKGGQEVKMGKRAGNIVTLRELMEEVGVDAARWFLTMRKTNSPMDFDLDVAVKQTLDNPVYYAQYAHARVCSICAKGIEKGLVQAADLRDGVWAGDFDAEALGGDEIVLLRHARSFPRTVERAATSLDPAILCDYLRTLSGAFQSYYQKRENVVLAEDDRVRRARLATCAAVQLTLRNGFRLLGVAAPERLSKLEA